jgi:hypothetical protein
MSEPLDGLDAFVDALGLDAGAFAEADDTAGGFGDLRRDRKWLSWRLVFK